jgi:hypothetical protein
LQARELAVTDLNRKIFEWKVNAEKPLEVAWVTEYARKQLNESKVVEVTGDRLRSTARFNFPGCFKTVKATREVNQCNTEHKLATVTYTSMK